MMMTTTNIRLFPLLPPHISGWIAGGLFSQDIKKIEIIRDYFNYNKSLLIIFAPSPYLKMSASASASEINNVTPQTHDCDLKGADVRIEDQKVITIRNIAYYTQTIEDTDLVLTMRPDFLDVSLKRFGCINLSNMDLDKIPDANFANVSAEDFKCDHNKLTALACGWPQHMQKLVCDHNKLTALPNTLPEGLQHLRCNDNELTELPEPFPKMVREFYCENNKLEKLPDLPASIAHISLDGNPLEANYPEIFKLGTAKEVVDYVNRRNRDMRSEPNHVITAEKLLELDLKGSTITQCIISMPDTSECLTYENTPALSFILSNVLSKLTLTEIVLHTSVKVMLHDQKGTDGYLWYKDLGLSVQVASSNIMARQLIEIVKYKGWKMTLDMELYKSGDWYDADIRCVV